MNTTCRNNGARKVVTDREVRGQASYPALEKTKQNKNTHEDISFTTCRNNGARKVVTDRQVRGQASHPALLLSP